MNYTNYSNVPLPIAVWLATDHYDYDARPNSISATTLLKPTKSFILTQRLKQQGLEGTTDILDLLAARLGSAIHDSIELAITHHYQDAMKQLGHPKKVIESIQVNPEEPGEDAYVFRLEERQEKELEGFIITGKYDIVEDGTVKDVKTTKTYSWVAGGKDDEYTAQGSIYRWLRPDLITKDEMHVLMIFTDWNPMKALASKDYPPKPVMVKRLPLWSLEYTENFIRNKINTLVQYLDADQEEMPECTPEELWQQPSSYAYYKGDPAKASRATKVFDELHKAQTHKANIGTGTVVHRPGVVKRCHWCPARSACLQADRLEQEGLLPNR
jgi:hypothetical protein